MRRAVHGDVPVSSATKIQQAMKTHDVHPITTDRQQSERTKTTERDHSDKIAKSQATHKDDCHHAGTITTLRKKHALVDERRQDPRAHPGAE